MLSEDALDANRQMRDMLLSLFERDEAVRFLASG